MAPHCQLRSETSLSWQSLPFYKCLNFPIDANFSFSFKFHTHLNTTGRETFVIYIGNLQKQKTKGRHCTVFINTDLKTIKGYLGHQCVNVAIIQSWIPQSVVNSQPPKTVVNFIPLRVMTLALHCYKCLFECWKLNCCAGVNSRLHENHELTLSKGDRRTKSTGEESLHSSQLSSLWLHCRGEEATSY